MELATVAVFYEDAEGNYRAMSRISLGDVDSFRHVMIGMKRDIDAMDASVIKAIITIIPAEVVSAACAGGLN